MTIESRHIFEIERGPALGATHWVRGLVVTASLLSASLAAFEVEADEYRIVAVGASNTVGRGVGAANAWPAQLEAMLRARRYDVRIVNAGVSGDDTSGMRARLKEAVPNGIRLVILDTTDTNDRRREVNTKANVAAIVGELSKRGVRTIVISSLHALSGQKLQGDGIHITAEGHAVIATRLAPQVTAIVGPPRRR